MNFSWEKLTVKNKVAVFALGALLISYLFYDYVLVPQWTHISEVTAQYNAEHQQVKIVEDFVLAHPNPEQHLVELDTKLLQIDKMLPDNTEMSSFLTQLEQLSRESGVQLDSLKPTKINNKEGYREIELEVLITGKFHNVMNFLNSTENGTRLISVTNIALQVTKEGLASKISAKVYSYGVPATVKPATPAADNAKPAEPKK